MDSTSASDIENILKILDSFGKSDTSRLKINVTEDSAQGESRREYHLGRCDINSPWACGTAFDVLEEEEHGLK